MAKPKSNNTSKSFHLEFLNPAQKLAWAGFEKHDVLFLLGPAGVGKTMLAVSFAIGEILAKRKKKIVLTRPIVEAGESLGFLPGDMEMKVDPYMMPVYDCIDKCVGANGVQREMVNRSLRKSPLAYMRGVTFDDSVCIFDEAQNATKNQLKMFLTRFGENSKVIITGDPKQSDLRNVFGVPLMDVVTRLETVSGVGVVYFKENSVVRHPLVVKILEKLEDA